MSFSRFKSICRIRTLCEVTTRISLREHTKSRFRFLKQNPGACTVDDLDMIAETDKDTRYNLLKAAPDIKEQYEEFQDDVTKVLGSLHSFARRAYPHCKVRGRWTDGTVIKALCTEWQDILEGKHPRTIINQPPATMKSLLANVIVPAYMWAIDPTWSVMQYGYNDDLPARDGQILLNLIRSAWYQRRFPHVKVKSASQSKIELVAGGWRMGQGWKSSATGFHPNLLVIDDPTKAGDVVNRPKELDAVVSWYAATIATRGMGHDKSAVVIVMQRLATNDLCGAILNEGVFGGTEEDEQIAEHLAQGFSWHHVCLPMFYDPQHPYLYPHDWRTKPGEILWGERFQLLDIKARQYEMEMDPDQGGMTTAAQFGQNPLAAQGAVFEGLADAYIGRDDYVSLNLVYGRAVRCWDRADSTTGDSTAGVLMVEKDGIYYIVDVITFEKRHADRDRIIERVAKADAAKFDDYRVAIEKPSGPDGGSAFEATYKRIHDRCHILTMAISPGNKSKSDRATPLVAAIKYGECRIIDGKAWKARLHTEFRLFPFAKHDDIVDGASGAMTALIRWAAGKV